MRIQIFDVSHGFCAYVVADNGNVMLIDCGHNETTGFRPSSYLVTNGCRNIDHLIIQNFDQDHLSDLPTIVATLPIGRFFRNQSITHEQLAILKKQGGPLSSAMLAAIDMHRTYIHPVQNPAPFPSIEFQTFCNSYPTFTDTNNLSVVSFLHYDGLGIIFPGDLEKTGWRELLKNPLFRQHLSRVNIFVASHHGRENGYCEEVFQYCAPHIVIISDKEIVHETQKHAYQQHCSGLSWNNGLERRYVLTTRSDGMITISKTVGTGYFVRTN